MLSNLIEVGTLVEVRFDRGDRIPNIGAKKYDGTRHVVSVKKSYGPAGSLFELDGAVSDKGVPYTFMASDLLIV